MTQSNVNVQHRRRTKSTCELSSHLHFVHCQGVFQCLSICIECPKLNSLHNSTAQVGVHWTFGCRSACHIQSGSTCKPLAIILLMALPPPPPTPMTLICASPPASARQAASLRGNMLPVTNTQPHLLDQSRCCRSTTSILACTGGFLIASGKQAAEGARYFADIEETFDESATLMERNAALKWA